MLGKANLCQLTFCTGKKKQPRFPRVTSSFIFRGTLRPHKPSGLSGMGSPGWPPRLWHSSWALRQFSVAFRPQRPYGPLWMGSPGRPPRLSHSSWALFFSVALRPQRPYGPLWMGRPGRPPTLSHSSWALPTVTVPSSKSENKRWAPFFFFSLFFFAWELQWLNHFFRKHFFLSFFSPPPFFLFSCA